MTLTYRVPAAAAGRTLQSICRRELSLSATQLRRLKAEQGLLVNGSPAFSSRLLWEGELISLTLSEAAPGFPPEAGSLSICWEDAHFLAVEKPQGMIVHPTHSRYTGTLAGRVWAHIQAQGGEGCHVVNRLDRDTGGLVLFAKSSWACRLLSQALAAEDTEKEYLALVVGTPPEAAGRISLPICRPDPRDLRRSVGMVGEAACTAYQVLESRDGLSLLRLRLYTGRTHQIRVHCSALGFPLLGDSLYGSPASLARSAELGQTMQALHCCRVRFRHPLGGEPVELHSRPSFPTFL